MEKKDPKDWILLKWGTIKGIEPSSEKAKALWEEYCSIGRTLGALSQKDTPRQKEIICLFIDLVKGKIFNDWSGKEMTHKEAKKYVMEYGA